MIHPDDYPVSQWPLSEADTRRQQPPDYPASQWPLAQTWTERLLALAWQDLIAQARAASFQVEDDGETVIFSEEENGPNPACYVKASRDAYEDAHAWLSGLGILSHTETAEEGK